MNEPPVGDPPVTETLTHDGVTTFNITAKDRAGNIALSAGCSRSASTRSAPTATIAAVPAQNANGWHDTPPTLTITATDAARSSGIAQVVYTVNNGDVHTTTGTAVPVAGNPTAGATLVVDPFSVTEGRNVVRFQVTDAAGNDSQLYTVNVNVDETTPNSTAVRATGRERRRLGTGQHRRHVHGHRSRLVPTASPARAWRRSRFSATKDPVKGGAVIALHSVNGTSTATTLSTEGITTYHFFATDVADNNESHGATRVVKLDKTAPSISLSLPATNANAPVGPQATDPGSGGPIPVYLLGQTPVKVDVLVQRRDVEDSSTAPVPTAPPRRPRTRSSTPTPSGCTPSRSRAPTSPATPRRRCSSTAWSTTSA